jgi:adenylate kinase
VEGVCDACGHELIQRKDDQAETIRNRLEVYHRETEPLKEFYQERNVLRKIDDVGGIKGTNENIMSVLGK